MVGTQDEVGREGREAGNSPGGGKLPIDERGGRGCYAHAAPYARLQGLGGDLRTTLI